MPAAARSSSATSIRGPSATSSSRISSSSSPRRARSPCYAPPPGGPNGPGRECRSLDDRGPNRRQYVPARARPRRSAPRDRTRVEGPAAAVGPLAAPDVLVPRELPGGPRRMRSSRATAGPATSSSIHSPDAARPRSRRAAEGRIGVGNDLNPFAHLLTAAKVEAPTAAEARTRATRAAPRAGRRRSARWREQAARDPCGRPATGGPRAGARGGRAGVPPADVRAAPVPPRALDLDVPIDRFLAAAIAGILHGKSPSYLSTLMPNTFSMAPRYVRDFAARTASARRSGTPSTASTPSSPACTAIRCRGPPGSRSSATRATRARVRGRRSGRAACPIARDWS